MWKTAIRVVSTGVLLVSGGALLGSAEDLYIQAAVNAAGSGGTLWSTELSMRNNGASATTVDVAFLEVNTDNSSPQVAAVILQPSESQIIADVLDSLFAQTATFGALRLTAPAGNVLAWSSTSNQASSGAILLAGPQRPATTACTFGEYVSLDGLTENADFRANIGMLNTTSSTIEIQAEFFRDDGEAMGTLSHFLPPFGVLQRNRPIQNDLGTTADDAYAILSTTTPGGEFFAFSNVVNNSSGDSFFAPDQKDPGTQDPIYIPWAASITTRDENWESTLQLRAADGGATALTLELLKTGEDNTSPEFETINIAAGHTARFEDVLASAFSHSGTGALRITPTTGTAVVTSWAAGGASSGMSHLVPSRSAREVTGDSGTAHLIGLHRSVDQRTDIGFVNTTNQSITIELTLHDSTGQSLNTTQHPIQPYGHLQVDDALLGNETAISAGVRTTTTGGAFLSYATVFDLGSGDAIHIPGFRATGELFADGFESGDTSAW